MLWISERDLRLVDAFYQDLGVQASDDPSQPTPEEQESIEWWGDRFEQLKAMTGEELIGMRAERRLRRL